MYSTTAILVGIAGIVVGTFFIHVNLRINCLLSGSFATRFCKIESMDFQNFSFTRLRLKGYKYPVLVNLFLRAVKAFVFDNCTQTTIFVKKVCYRRFRIFSRAIVIPE